MQRHRANASTPRAGDLLTDYRSVNAAAESFFATLKTELLHRAVWTTRQHARTAVFRYIEGFYNRRAPPFRTRVP